MSEKLKPILTVEKSDDTLWEVYMTYSNNDLAMMKRKDIGQFVRDVDGDWLFFFDEAVEYRGGGWPRHILSELVAAFDRFMPMSGPE